jgi:ribose 5-phosphate isomerase A
MKDAEKALAAKRRAAIEAARMVQDSAVVGLGTGSTAAFAIEELGRRLREESFHCHGVPTSFSAAMLARKNGIPLVTLDDVEEIHVAIDGADEVDPHKNLIKGGGAAHTREKIVDSLANYFIVVVDESKMVKCLGERCPVPVEVLPFAATPVMRRLRVVGAEPKLRMSGKKDGPVVTDQGNFIIDAWFKSIENPDWLEKELNYIPGVMDNGIFANLAHLIIIAPLHGGDIRKLE